MAVTASGTATGPRRRYAPEDPTLPKPWRGLVDLSTGYLYFWNPETNITQYERPVSASSPPPTSKSESTLENPSVQFQQPSGSSIQDTGATCCHSQNALSGSTSAGYGAESVRSSGVYQPVDMGVGSSESYRRRHEITVIGNNVPAPFMTFQSTGFPSEILREVCHAGFSAPTPIQAQSWPIALQNRDIVAVAKTGSGKTLGYLIPGFIHLKRRQNNSRLGPSVLVLAPTRELATQIQDEAVKFASSSKISSTCLYGGAPKGPQLRDLDRGTDIVVATPGRLNDILGMKRVNLQQVSYLVLDEADRMLDMGFEPQIRQIVKEIPTHRQTLMYTATWPKEVRKIAADLMVTPVQVNIGNVDELVANKSITQYVEVMTHLEKRRRLEQILRSQEPGSKAIVFCSTKKMCDQLSSGITRQFGAASIHGDKSQDERDRVLNQFRSGKSPVLVATDVAARGLDIKDIRVVVNYDFPTGVEDYVHRIGRTGRAGATGVAYTFFCDQDAKHASNLIKVLEGASQQVPPDLRAMVGRGGGMGGSRRWGSSSGHEGGRSYGAGQSDSNDGDYDGGMGGSRRWDSSSGGHEGDRSLGAGQSDSNDGDSGGGWGAISSGWSERFRSGQGHEGSEPCDRRDEGGFPGTNNDRTDDREHRHVNSPGSRSRSRSRSQSPSRRDVHPAF